MNQRSENFKHRDCPIDGNIRVRCNPPTGEQIKRLTRLHKHITPQTVLGRLKSFFPPGKHTNGETMIQDVMNYAFADAAQRLAQKHSRAELEQLDDERLSGLLETELRSSDSVLVRERLLGSDGEGGDGFVVIEEVVAQLPSRD